jgi:hypothetical protein
MTVATVPFEIVSDRIAYVGGTRVTLDTVIYTFLEGATAEEIVQRYPSLKLADVYAVIAYYLQNKEEVEGFLRISSKSADEVRALNKKRFPPDGFLERLLARKWVMC